jgi:hypothetical protein
MARNQAPNASSQSSRLGIDSSLRNASLSADFAFSSIDPTPYAITQLLTHTVLRNTVKTSTQLGKFDEAIAKTVRRQPIFVGAFWADPALADGAGG